MSSHSFSEGQKMNWLRTAIVSTLLTFAVSYWYLLLGAVFVLTSIFLLIGTTFCRIRNWRERKRIDHLWDEYKSDAIAAHCTCRGECPDFCPGYEYWNNRKLIPIPHTPAAYESGNFDSEIA